MLTVLGGLAEFEKRELIKARTAEGRKRAQARGVRFGTKLKLTPHQRREALARREAGEAHTEIGRTFGVSAFNHLSVARLAAPGGNPSSKPKSVHRASAGSPRRHRPPDGASQCE